MFQVAAASEIALVATADHLAFEMIPATRERHYEALVDLSKNEWIKAEYDQVIHEEKLKVLLSAAVELEGDLVVDGLASRRYADIVASRAEQHKQAEAELQTFREHRAKLMAQRHS